MLRTAFQAVDNGFHFSNNDVEWQLHIPFMPFLKGKNVCGGMCYAALDYWYARQSPPTQTKVPPLGTELNEYLVDRQISAHGFAIPRVLGATNFRMRADVFKSSVEEEIPKIIASLRTGRPIPLLLIRDKMLDCHFVLAIACTPPAPGGTFTDITVYDPNQPDKIVQFWVNAGISQMNLANDGNVTFGFYADTSYDFSDPPFIPDERVAPLPLPVSPYLVKEGDTLFGLATRFYGVEARWEDIYEANSWAIGRDGPRMLKAGQVLTLPD
jgi:hypothetical protein